MDLLNAWAAWRPTTPPFVLAADRDILSANAIRDLPVVLKGWRDAFRRDDFCAPGDRHLHLGLLPEPFTGPIRRASVYILLLNPGLGPTDYYGEYEVRAFRRARLQNLRQLRGSYYPFYMLDPQFAWHGGFDWWHQKLAGVISELARRRSESFAAARKRLAHKIASIELIPYHSGSFDHRGRLVDRLPSARLAKAFVHDAVIPRVRRKEAIVIATRQAAVWDLPRLTGVVRYSPQQARAAHLSPNSPGGRAILGHLSR